MCDRRSVAVLITVVIFALVCFSACDDDIGANNDLPNVTITHETPSIDPNTPNGSGTDVPDANATQSPNPPDVDVDYASLIPDIDFGDRLMSFKKDSSKTFLYADVAYDEVEQYAHEMLDMGYVISQFDVSEEDDRYNVVFVEESKGVTVWIKYQSTGLSIVVGVD